MDEEIKKMDDDGKWEFQDPENYTPEKEQKFSHQILVMQILKKCLEAKSKEMKEGYFNEKVDRMGNVIKTYVEDTRNVFIESVETAMAFMECDYDQRTQEKIAKIKKDLDEFYKELVEIEKKDFNLAPPTLKKYRRMNGLLFREGCLNKHLPYYQEYIETKVKAYTKILTELNNLTKDLNFYEVAGVKT